MYQLRFYTLLLITIGSLQSCVFQPAIDDAGQITSRAPSQIARTYGAYQFELIKKRKKISHDRRYTEPVARVAKRLKEVIDIPEADWEFVIFKDNSANAFALSGGKVGINTGLFKLADNDALLAAVLGHEISHAAANHPEQRMVRALATVVLGAAFWATMDHHDVKHPGVGMGGYVLAAYLIDFLPLARRQEYESDRIGAVYMAQAGYDPRQAVELWRKIEHHHKESGKKPDPEYLRTHPLDAARIKALEDFMPVALKHYRK